MNMSFHFSFILKLSWHTPKLSNGLKVKNLIDSKFCNGMVQTHGVLTSSLK
jgi:hypothetical protein